MSTQPQATLYLNNLNEKIHKDELRIQLYALFTTYGKIIDIIASKSPAMRGQAFLVFSDLTGATSALRACDGMVFYDKPMVSTIRALSAPSLTQAAHRIRQEQVVRDVEARRPQLCAAQLCQCQCTRPERCSQTTARRLAGCARGETQG